VSVARTRWRSVCANDHSPSTETSDRAGRHRGRAVEGGSPGALEDGPGRAQALRVVGASVGAAGEAPVELGLDVGDHVDAVDAQVAAVRQPRGVDVGLLDLHPAHHDAGQVGADEPGALQVGLDEPGALQVVG
jgi:hypothetical protein